MKKQKKTIHFIKKLLPATMCYQHLITKRYYQIKQQKQKNEMGSRNAMLGCVKKLKKAFETRRNQIVTDWSHCCLKGMLHEILKYFLNKHFFEKSFLKFLFVFFVIFSAKFLLLVINRLKRVAGSYIILTITSLKANDVFG